MAAKKQKKQLGYLEYPLQNGYIHHWVVAGPQALEVKELQRFSGPEWKLQVARHYYQPQHGVTGTPGENMPCQAGDFAGEWRYIRTKDDHYVDISAFYHLTHYLMAWAYCEVYSQVDQDVSMILTTNGPADVWVNGDHVHRQEHFYHQIPNRVKFSGRLKTGYNAFLVRMEEVAARECPFTMALQLVNYRVEGEYESKVIRIASMAPDLTRRMFLENLFEESYLRQDVYRREDDIEVILPEGPANTAEFNVRLQNAQAQIYGEAFRSHRREPTIAMMKSYEVPEGSYQILMIPTHKELYEHNIRVSRSYDVYAANNIFSSEPYGTYEDRRQEALLDAARRDVNVFCEIAKMEIAKWGSVSEPVILDAIAGINQRKDCSDFYLCGLLSMLYRFGEDPSFPDGLRQPLEDCILNFKYWNDEPGSDAMCYTTENHSLLFHACEILAGQLYPDRVFSNTNQTGSWHIAKGERLALAWLTNRAASGFKEWDSNVYFEEDTLSLSTLATHAENENVWEMASVILDKMYFTMALNSYKGVFGSTKGRTYTPMIKGAYRECTSGISRLLWGMGIFNDRVLGTVSLAISSYELPPVIAAIAADLPDEMWSREQHIGTEQDFRDSGSIGTGVNKVTYKTADYMLCSAQDWHPGEKGYQQHIWQATLSPLATVFTTHPPCAAEDGSHRPNFWHGNETLPRVAQWKDVLVAAYNFREDDWMGFTHAYFPAHAFDRYEVNEHWAFGQVGDGYIALTAARGLEFMRKGDNAYRELRSYGHKNIWVCQMGRAALDGTFEEFQQKVLALAVAFSDDEVSLISLRGETVRFGWKGALKINGKVKKISGFKHYDNPYASVKLGESAMQISYGLQAVKLDFAISAEGTDPER